METGGRGKGLEVWILRFGYSKLGFLGPASCIFEGVVGRVGAFSGFLSPGLSASGLRV